MRGRRGPTGRRGLGHKGKTPKGNMHVAELKQSASRGPRLVPAKVRLLHEISTGTMESLKRCGEHMGAFLKNPSKGGMKALILEIEAIAKVDRLAAKAIVDGIRERMRKRGISETDYPLPVIKPKLRAEDLPAE